MSFVTEAALDRGAYFEAAAHWAYRVGVGGFTVHALVSALQPGVVLSRASDGPDGGFELAVEPGGAVRFSTFGPHGGHRHTVTHRTGVLDGGCHSVAGVRDGGKQVVVVDGVVLASTRGEPLNVDNDLPLLIGTGVRADSGPTLAGALRNVGIWHGVLTGDALTQAVFERIDGMLGGIAGYWPFDGSSEDLSSYRNTAQPVGTPQFRRCLSSVWTRGEHGYRFAQIGNVPGPEEARAGAGSAPVGRLSMLRTIDVAPGTPALFVAIMADQEKPAFPDGASVAVADPSGKLYDHATDSDHVFVSMHDEEPWTVAVVHPQPGTWTIAVGVPPDTAFVMQAVTCPSHDVVRTVEASLTPLFGPDTVAHELVGSQRFGDWLHTLTELAVAAVAGVAMGALAAFVLVTSWPVAVVSGVAAFCGVAAALLWPDLKNLGTATWHLLDAQVAALAGFVVAAEHMLVVDSGNVIVDKGKPNNMAVKLYEFRRDEFYPKVADSVFGHASTVLCRRQVTRDAVHQKLESMGPGYVTMSGHGNERAFQGWQEMVLSSGSITPKMAAGKIFHVLACSTGADDPSGLGLRLVAQGAFAFFGYTAAIDPSTSFADPLVDCDMAIDIALMAGKTCKDAHDAAVAKYNRQIAFYRSMGRPIQAGSLERARDALVSPVVRARNGSYGLSGARLAIGPERVFSPTA